MAIWPELYILRHGETEWNATGRIQGSLDSVLTDRGRQQAEAQGEILAQLDLAGFEAWSSPQRRARQTTEIALASTFAHIRVDDRLREIALGDWEGRLREDLAPDFFADELQEEYLHDFDRAPGGEGFAELNRRCRSFLQALARPAVIVTHGMTSRMLRLTLLDLDLADLPTLPGGQGVVFHVKDGVHQTLG